MRTFIFLILNSLGCFIFLFNTVPLSAQTLAHDRVQLIQRGQNFSNWLEATWQTNYPNPTAYTRQSVQDMKEAGMKSLRLPVTFAHFTDQLPPYNIHTDNMTFALIDSAIVWAEELDMILIIDNHHGWEISTGNYLEQIPRMAAMWKQLAEYFNELDPERYFFEIWNEPPLLLPESIIRPFYQACIDSIRTVTTQHTLVIGAHAANLGLALAVTTPYEDYNIIYTFHVYEPYNFTHQGFPWAQPFPFPTGTPFPLNNNDTLLTNIFYSVSGWRDTNNVPVFLGEFGVGIHADYQSRCNWMSHIGNLITELNIPWIYWDWQYDFSWFNELPSIEENVISCFKEALHLYEDITVGNNDFQKQIPQILLYPNPLDSSMDLKILTSQDLKQIYITDLSGKVLKHETLKSVNVEEEFSISLSEFSTGTYFTVFTTSNGQFTLPLLLR